MILKVLMENIAIAVFLVALLGVTLFVPPFVHKVRDAFLCLFDIKAH